MKITKQHEKNSQVHSIPDDTFKHTISLTCGCSPKLEIKNGHILVEHRRNNKGKLWSLKLKNFGTKLKLPQEL
jgi:hypothetical protein